MNSNIERARKMYRAGQQLQAQANQIDPAGCPAPYGNNANGVRDCGPSLLNGSYLCGSCRVYALPVDSGDEIDAGATVEIPVARPQKPFLPQLFVVASDFASFFLIHDISIGTNTQAVAKGVQAATVYSEVAVNNLLNLDPIGPGVDVFVTVENIDTDPHRFLASMFGTAVPV